MERHVAHMTPQQQYDRARQMTEKADRNGGDLPVELLKQSADAGYTPAIYALATWYLHGKGVKQNRKRAVELFKIAASKRNADAEYDLAVCHELGVGGLRKNARAALVLYRRAAADGCVQAFAEAARCYYYGLGAAPDPKKSFVWYRKAALRGDVEAQYTLGRAYEFGDGVEENARLAIRWYLKAAAQGDASARTAAEDLKAEACFKPSHSSASLAE